MIKFKTGTYYFFWVVLFTVLFNPYILLGQDNPIIVAKYQNGNSLVKKNGLFELKSKNDETIESWNYLGKDIYINDRPYKRVIKEQGKTKKQGIFDSESGVIIAAALYDDLRGLTRPYEKIILLQNENKYGLLQLEGASSLQPIYNWFTYHPNGNLLLAKDSASFLFNKNLQIVDSTIGFKRSRNLYFRKETFLVAYLLYGMALIDKQNKLIYDKDWTNIEDFAGENLIVSTKNGYGLYNIVSRKITEPYKYRTYKCKGYFNEQILFAEKNQWKLFDSSGKQLLTMQADSIVPALDEWSGFFFQKNKKWGFIDLEGKVLQQPIWKSMWNPRFDNFEATLTNGKIKHYYYKYKTKNDKLIISGIGEGVSVAESPN